MRTWKRATDRLRCGAGAECWIPQHEPYLLIHGVTWTKIRCVQHAGAQPPIDLDAPASQPVSPSSFTSMKTLAKVLPMRTLPRDVKAAQAKDSE